MITRRGFLKASMAGSAFVMSPRSALNLFATPALPGVSAPLLEVAAGERLITFLHTNDTHSQIDPLPANDGLYPDKVRHLPVGDRFVNECRWCAEM